VNSESDTSYTLSLSERDAPEASDKSNHDIPFIPLVEKALKEENNAFVERVNHDDPIEEIEHDQHNTGEKFESILPVDKTKGMSSRSNNKTSPVDHSTIELKADLLSTNSSLSTTISAEIDTLSLTKDIKMEKLSSNEKITSVMTWTATSHSDHEDEQQLLSSLSDRPIGSRKPTSGRQSYIIKSMKNQQLTVDRI